MRRAEGHGQEHGCACVGVCPAWTVFTFLFHSKYAGQTFYLGVIRFSLPPPFLFLFLSYGIKGEYRSTIIYSSSCLAVEEDSTPLLGLANLKLHLRADKDRAETATHDCPSVQRPKEIRKHPHRVLETQAEANQICHHHHENVAHCTNRTQMAIVWPASPLIRNEGVQCVRSIRMICVLIHNQRL